MIKFLTRSSQSITGAAIVISSATLVSRLVGMIRDRVFAHEFGSGAIIDAYQAAFRVPDLMYNLLIIGALTAGYENTGDDKAKESTSQNLPV
jgi:putative peptidoglycan lipid II flippase